MVFDKICEIIIEQQCLSNSNLTMESSFEDDLGADSLDLFEIISSLESEFDMDFSPEDIEEIKTIGDAVNYINEHLAEIE